MPRRVKIGRVVSTAMANTIVVEVERLKQHPRYKKYIRVRKKFMAHDAREQAVVGDTVRIIECAPVSKRKRWELVDVVARGVGPEVELKPEAGVEEMLRARKEAEEAQAAEKTPPTEEAEVSAEAGAAVEAPAITETVDSTQPVEQPENNQSPAVGEPRRDQDEEVAAG